MTKNLYSELYQMSNSCDNYGMYLHKLASVKDAYKLTWCDIAELINDAFDLAYSEDKYRKEFSRESKMMSYQTIYSSNNDEESKTESNSIEDSIREFKLERIKLQKERTQNNRYLQLMAREQTIKEIADNFAHVVASESPLVPYSEIKTDIFDSKAAVLMISDWHYGIKIDNFWNHFNIDICKDRIQQLKDETIDFLRTNKITTLVVVNLSDMIAGNIHSQIRLSSQEDVISQVMHSTELISEMLYEFSEHARVHYFDCIDNHSRIDPNKSESVRLESLTEISHWFLKNRFEGHQNIKVIDNLYSRDIITFELFGWNFAGVHGDLDKQNDVVKNLTLMTQKNYDVIMTAHLHHFSANEDNGCIILSNPCLMGTDDFAERLRKHSSPAQILFTVSKTCPVDIIKRMVLK